MKRIIAAGIAAAVLFFVSVSGVGCVYRRIFGIICPGCGMTRAVTALLRFDIKTAFMYHPMVFSLPIIFLYIVKNGRVFRSRALDGSVIGIICAGFVINYIVRLNVFGA